MADEPTPKDEKAEEKQDGAEKGPAAAETPPPPHFEEEVAATEHEAFIAGEQVHYRVDAGRMLLREEEGKRKASFFYVAYTRDDDATDSAARPIVFCFNGGPGSSSVWLHLGAFGPRRVEMSDDGKPYPPPGRLVDNEDSLLDVADLVFVDPVGTGFSRAIPGEEAKEFHHFKRDIEAVGEFIRIYVARHGRWASPKFIAGESYGTTRAAGLAGHLYNRHGMALNGLILVSSILNFQTTGFDRKTWTFERGNDLPYSVFLPTYTAAAWYHGRLEQALQGKPLREVLDEVEEFTATEYTLALFAGDALEPARFDAVAERVAAYTGLPVEYVKAYHLRIEILRFCKELLRADGRTIGRIDARYTGIDRFSAGDAMESDPSIDAVLGPYTSALNDYVRRELEYESELPYEIMSEKVWENWDYEDFKNAHVDVSETLRETMSRNPFMRVFVANGYYDLATPHFATEYTFRHLGLDPALRENVQMGYYEAGHMMYVHMPSRQQLAADLRAFLAGPASG
jgi:carboxypeptidase C (cathepsin A)